MTTSAGLKTVDLKDFIGRRIHSITVAAGMRMFTWRLPTEFDLEGATELALHVQCPWRLEVCRNILTGSEDFYQSEDPEIGPDDDWDPNRGGNIQEALLRTVVNPRDPHGVLLNRSSNLLCVDFRLAERGLLYLYLNNDMSLVLFPASGQREAWRVFWPKSNSDHLVYPNESTIGEDIIASRTRQLDPSVE